MGSNDVPLSLLAGHRYVLRLSTEIDPEILRNALETRTLTREARVDFTLTIPEPFAATFLVLAPMLLKRRRAVGRSR